MAFKIFALVALAAVAKASLIPVAPLAARIEAPANYRFGYQVNDPITGDNKHQEETRLGDAVRGSYSLVESDGTRRVVDYFDDGFSGFNAVVRKEPLAGYHVARVAPAVVAPAVRVAPPAVHVAAVPAVRSWSGLYSPYQTANPWSSHYLSPYGL